MTLETCSSSPSLGFALSLMNGKNASIGMPTTARKNLGKSAVRSKHAQIRKMKWSCTSSDVTIEHTFSVIADSIAAFFGFDVTSALNIQLVNSCEQVQFHKCAFNADVCRSMVKLMPSKCEPHRKCWVWLIAREFFFFFTNFSSILRLSSQHCIDFISFTAHFSSAGLLSSHRIDKEKWTRKLSSFFRPNFCSAESMCANNWLIQLQPGVNFTLATAVRSYIAYAILAALHWFRFYFLLWQCMNYNIHGVRALLNVQAKVIDMHK